MQRLLRGLEQAGWQQICEQYDVWELRVLRSIEEYLSVEGQVSYVSKNFHGADSQRVS